MKNFWKTVPCLVALTVAILCLSGSGCGKQKMKYNLQAEYKKRITEGFRHYHIVNHGKKPYNLIMLVRAEASGELRICASAHAKGVRDNGDFDIYVKTVDDGFLLHYAANDEYVQLGVKMLKNHVIKPGEINFGDFIVKASDKPKSSTEHNWNELAPGESAFALVVMEWDGDFIPDSSVLLEAVKNKMQR